MGLTAMQEGMLFHYLANPGSRQYFEQFRFKLIGKIDIRRFEEAWAAVAQVSEMLRSVIRWEQLEEPVQIVLKDKGIPIRVFDLTGEKKDAIQAVLDKIVMDDKNEAIDLTCNPLRITLSLAGDDESEMLITFHHIIYDGWSNGIVLKEFLGAYNRLVVGETPENIEKTKYKEFIKWYQNDRVQNKAKHEDFWKNYLAGFDTRTLLPYDKNKTEDILRVQTVREELAPAFKKRVDEFAQLNNTTLAAILYAAWGILLQKYNNSDDIIFGTTVSGRIPGIKGIDSMVGLFINTIPFRLKTTGEHSVFEVLAEVGAHLKERSSHEHTPLTDIGQWTGMGKESHLFDSIFVIDNYPFPVSDVSDRTGASASDSVGLAIKSYETFEMTEFDLTLQIMLPGTDTGVVKVDFHYNADVFETGTIQRLAGHYLNILAGITSDPKAKIAEVEVLSEVEVQQILCEFNDPGIEFELNKTIHGEIEKQAARIPGNRAVQFGDRWLSYQELNESANRLAHLLKAYGVSGGCRVVLLMPRSIEMIVGLLGILKAGAACIPLDISYPVERNGFILQDSEAGFLLKHSFVESIAAPGVREIIYDLENLNAYGTDNLNIAVKPMDLAYIIYTSGSTGKPKGALLHHSGIVNHTYTKIGVLGITEADTVANNFSINVIAAVWQVLAPLFMGARLVVYTDEVEWDPYLQFQVVEADGVTVIELIPPVLKTYLFLLDEGKEKIKLEKLRKIALTSEETKPFVVNKFYEKYIGIDLVDCYGQTECSDDIMHYTIPVDTDTRKVPIGRPSLNTNVFILNHHYQLQPVGVVGEICAIGAGVCYGYWKRAEMTAEKFIKSFRKSRNPFSKGFLAAGGTLYKTGDLGKWMPDGRVEFLGRIDHQVKIRGNRVELREIENHVLRYSGIKEAAVVAREDREGEKNLYAFFVSSGEVPVSEIRQYLLKTLPDYMVPAHFMPLASLPLTPNGKIDRKALVSMEVDGNIGIGEAYLPPRSEYESKIQEIWKELLEKEKIGVDDNFFDLGGHSLLLIKLKSKLEKNFKLKRAISVVELFRYPTIARQAAFIEGNVTGKADAEVKKEEAKETQETRLGSRDIAVIGIAMRVPGATGIDEFWRNIINGVESITFFQEDELESSEAYQVIKGSSKLIAAGGVMGDIDLFDADFFGYHPREAELMDPQQRIFLEYAWKALEDAGYMGETYPGSIGVYAGVGWNTYLLNNVLKNPGVIKTQGEFQTMIGNDKDFLTTRVSYKLNLKGPSVAIQSACSTSLTAVHLARQALLAHDCDIALSGGIAVKIPEKTGYFYTEGGHLSPDGHCRPFDAAAKGTVFGNGVGIVVLKRLSEAVKDNDHIYAVIKGSAINNDGSLKVGFHSPGESGQADVVLKALQESRIQPHTIGYVETHGTGTVLGDPVEISALIRAYGSAGSGKQYCALGSVKANIGHLDVAAGVIGLIKAVLCLKYKQIPPSINVTEPNPLIGFADSPFYVNLKLRDWPDSETPRRAAASSLGIGGTNAHVILEEYLGGSVEGSGVKQYELILLSAKTQTALEQQARNLADYLRKNTLSINMADAVYTLHVGRARFHYRQMFVCSNKDEAIEALTNSEKREIFFSEPGSRPVIFMFPGQGSQYVDMGLYLYQNVPVFRREMDHCFEILQPIIDYDIKTILYPSLDGNRDNKSYRSNKTDIIDQTEITQPVIFTIEYALAKLLMNWGVKPHAMIGHSIGEYTAACLSGVLTLEDTLKLVVARGKLMQKMPPGAMLSVPILEKDLLTILEENSKNSDAAELSLAAVNSSNLCTVSGPHDAVYSFEKLLKLKGYDSTLLHTSHAFHSPMMNPILKEFEETAKRVRLNPPQIPYISNLTGDWITEKETTSPTYWANHLRQTVRFADGIRKLLEITVPIFIEVGPGRTASTFVKQHLGTDKNDGTVIIDLVRHPKKQISDSYYLLNSIGQLWLHGVEIDWKEFHAGQERHRVPLPTYPFAKNSYWLQPGNDATVDKEIIEEGKKKIEDWFYIPTWKQTAPSFLDRQEIEKNLAQPKCWLFFLTTQEQLIPLLKEKGQHIITVTIGAQFARTGEDAYEINPGCPNDYNALLEDIVNHDKTIDKIVHFWTKSELSDILLERGIYSLLYLVKALGKQSLFNLIEFWIISDHMFKIESGDTISPLKETIPGPCKVISQEYPNIICRNLEIDTSTEILHNLFLELNVSPPDRVIAYRGNTRWVQSHEPIKLGNYPGIPIKLRQNGVYLITGGLGRIGFTFAHYLAQTVHAKLILTDRRYLTGDPRIKSLEETGAEVQVIEADVSVKEQMVHARRLVEARFGDIHGIIHTAGVMSDEHFKPISQLDKETCEIHFGPKIYGANVIADVFKDKTLDFCILTSSLSAVLGGIGLYAYSAANSFMDALAREQSQVYGNNWISINWDEWQRDRSPGCIRNTASITSEEGKEALQRVLSMNSPGTPQVVISCRSLDKRLRQWVLPVSAPVSSTGVQDESAGAKSAVHKRPQLQNIYEEPQTDAEKIAAEIWEQLLGIAPVGVQDDFFALGGHSLLATKLIARMREVFRIDLPLNILFDKPTIREIVGHVVDTWGDAETVEEIARTYREVFSN
ncbi:MAG: hypothetical protein QG657_651 [Acidobacteriota bacterium]|nr:hypothetical protein [Acidobacteriota bacterium]